MAMIRAEPPVQIILGVVLVLAVLAIRKFLANPGETPGNAPRPVLRNGAVVWRFFAGVIATSYL